MKRLLFNNGEEVISAGDQSDDIYFLSSGSLTMIKDGLSIGTISCNEFFGESGFIQRKPRAISVIATERSVIFRLAREDFRSIFNAGRYFNKIPLLTVLREKDQECLQEDIDIVHFLRDNTIVASGMQPTHFYIVLNGSVEVNGTVLDGERFHYFGHECFLGPLEGDEAAPMTHPHTCKVLSHSAMLWQLTAKGFRSEHFADARHLLEVVCLEERKRERLALKPPPPEPPQPRETGPLPKLGGVNEWMENGEEEEKGEAAGGAVAATPSLWSLLSTSGIVGFSAVPKRDGDGDRKGGREGPPTLSFEIPALLRPTSNDSLSSNAPLEGRDRGRGRRSSKDSEGRESTGSASFSLLDMFNNPPLDFFATPPPTPPSSPSRSPSRSNSLANKSNRSPYSHKPIKQARSPSPSPFVDNIDANEFTDIMFLPPTGTAAAPLSPRSGPNTEHGIPRENEEEEEEEEDGGRYKRYVRRERYLYRAGDGGRHHASNAWGIGTTWGTSLSVLDPTQWFADPTQGSRSSYTVKRIPIAGDNEAYIFVKKGKGKGADETGTRTATGTGTGMEGTRRSDPSSSSTKSSVGSAVGSLNTAEPMHATSKGSRNSPRGRATASTTTSNAPSSPSASALPRYGDIYTRGGAGGGKRVSGSSQKPALYSSIDGSIVFP